MPDIVPNEPQGIKERRVVSPAEVRKWLEIGPKDSPLMYGTGLKTLDRITRSGKVPSSDIQLPYQRELVSDGESLYYFLPVINQLRVSSPGFASEYTDFQERNSASPGEYSSEHLENGVRHYAFVASLEGKFETSTNIRAHWHTLLAIAKEVSPSELERDPFLSDEYHLDEEKDPKILRDVKTTIKIVGKEKMQATIPEILKRRGFIIYFKPSIISSSGLKLYTGYEIEEDVIGISKRPLTSDAVSGIVPLSDYDRIDLYDLVYPATKR
ncbi:MAG: hypothetical protein Q8Q49_00725 [bacterium]|nr:hypothetical protein [bacterium]